MIHGKKFIGTVAYMGGVPAVLERFCWDWSQMIQYNSEYLCDPGELVHYDRATVSYHAYARNNLSDRFLGDWLMMLDTDHSFEPDLVARLVRTMQVYDLDVVTGLYMYRIPPNSPLLFVKDGEKLTMLGDWDRDIELVPVDSAGGGCLLIRRRVFQRIKAELHENPFEIRNFQSEDHSFFDRVRQLKIQPYCAQRVVCGHLRADPVLPDDYRPDPSLIGPRRETETIGMRN